MTSAPSNSNVIAHYCVRAGAASIEDRALQLAVEQSVEMPLAAVRDPEILSRIVGKVRTISAAGDGWFHVRIELAATTIGDDAGQLLNILFGNSSMQDDVVLHDADFPQALLASFGGPNHGLGGVRRLAGVEGRALTCCALKPQGLSAAELAKLAFAFAQGGVDFIKDDHGLADQAFSPFEDRVKACAAAVRDASRSTGKLTRYVPSLSGSFEEIDRRLDIAAREGLQAAMLAPAVIGASNFVALKRRHPRFHFFAHPSMTGCARISPPLYARLFRVFGADAVIFPNYGGRFAYSAQTCRGVAEALRAPLGALRGAAPVPAGGLTTNRAPEILRFYGQDAILLIGGDLQLAGLDKVAAGTERFVQAVEGFRDG
jgi:ribulose-bisphosphate carboxylase large chain